MQGIIPTQQLIQLSWKTNQNIKGKEICNLGWKIFKVFEHYIYIHHKIRIKVTFLTFKMNDFNIKLWFGLLKLAGLKLFGQDFIKFEVDNLELRES